MSARSAPLTNLARDASGRAILVRASLLRPTNAQRCRPALCLQSLHSYRRLTILSGGGVTFKASHTHGAKRGETSRGTAFQWDMAPCPPCGLRAYFIGRRANGASQTGLQNLECIYIQCLRAKELQQRDDRVATLPGSIVQSTYSEHKNTKTVVHQQHRSLGPRRSKTGDTSPSIATNRIAALPGHGTQRSTHRAQINTSHVSKPSEKG